MNDCHECRFRVSLYDHFGMSDVSCECGQTTTCKWISVAFLLKSIAIVCLYTVSMATRTVIIGESSSVFRKQ